jgi:hypothetical protein
LAQTKQATESNREMKPTSHDTPSTKSELAIVTGFLILFLVFEKAWLLYVAVLLAGVFLVSEKLSAWILAAWWKLAEVLGTVNRCILLSLVYVGILWPLALLRRLLRQDVLSLRSPPKDTLFKERERAYRKEDFEKLW